MTIPTFALAVLAGLFIYLFISDERWDSARLQSTIVVGDTVAKALDGYKKKHGNYPPDLSALAPEFIAMVPDPYVGTKKWYYKQEYGGESYFLSVYGSDVDADPVFYRTNDPEWRLDTR